LRELTRSEFFSNGLLVEKEEIMKLSGVVRIAMAFFSAACAAYSQGTELFFSYLDGSHAIPPNGSARTANGQFFLEPNLIFNADISIRNYSGITAVSLFRSVPSELGTKLFDLSPGPISIGIGGSGEGQHFGTDADRIMTLGEVNDLRAGLWWAAVTTPEFPNGEIRGQIFAVPEPSVIAFVGVGAAVLLVVRRRSSAWHRRSCEWEKQIKLSRAVGVFFLWTALNAYPQATTFFSSNLNGSQAVPPNVSSRTGTGEFYLYSDLTFNGGIWIANYAGITEVSLFRATSVMDLGTKLFDLAPGPVSIGIGGTGSAQAFGTDIDRVLTPLAANDLQSGFWWVVVATPEFPNGEIRGQLSAVPEPSTFALLGLGAAAFLIV
jgi:hypothetical protein